MVHGGAGGPGGAFDSSRRN